MEFHGLYFKIGKQGTLFRSNDTGLRFGWTNRKSSSVEKSRNGFMMDLGFGYAISKGNANNVVFSPINTGFP